MEYPAYLHIKPFQLVGDIFNVYTAFWREIPRRVLFFSFGLGMLDQIKEHHNPPDQVSANHSIIFSGSPTRFIPGNLYGIDPYVVGSSFSLPS